MWFFRCMYERILDVVIVVVFCDNVVIVCYYVGKLVEGNVWECVMKFFVE